MLRFRASDVSAGLWFAFAFFCTPAAALFAVPAVRFGHAKPWTIFPLAICGIVAAAACFVAIGIAISSVQAFAQAPLVFVLWRSLKSIALAMGIAAIPTVAFYVGVRKWRAS